MPSEAGPTRAERLALSAIHDNIRLAQGFVDGMTVDEFAQDRRTFYAVTRCLEIISEAARRLGPSQKETSPHLEGFLYRYALRACTGQTDDGPADEILVRLAAHARVVIPYLRPGFARVLEEITRRPLQKIDGEYRLLSRDEWQSICVRDLAYADLDRVFAHMKD